MEHLAGSSGIRAMFEEGAQLKNLYGAENVFDFSIGNPDPEPPQETKEALRKLVLEDKPGLHWYMSNAGYACVREKIAAGLNKASGCSSLTADNIVMTVGAGGGLNVILKSLLNPGEEVIVLAPFFVEYGFYIDNHGGKMVIVQTNPETFQPDLDALEAAITPRTKAILINSPHNPTGVIYKEEILRAMALLMEEKEREYGTAIFLISDEPYRDIVYDGAKVPSVLSIFKNALIGYSYSKSLSLPGERIGYVAANNQIENVSALMEALVFANRSLGFVNAPSLFQKVVGASLGAAVDVSIYQERRDLLYNHLIECGFACVKPEGAFYLFPKCPTDDVVEFKNRALKHNIILVPGTGFGSPKHFRLAYCCSAETIRRSLPAWSALASELGL
jgi:aspartate aminotransferase